MTLVISWSSLKRYEFCGQQQLRYSEGKAVRSRWFGRDVLAGNVADRAMRAWLSNNAQGNLKDFAEDYWDRFTNRDRGEEDYAEVAWRGNPIEDRREIHEFVMLVTERLEPILMRYVVPHDYQPEMVFRTVIGVPYLDGEPVAITLRGGMDIVVRLRADIPELGMQTGDMMIFDLKATKNDSYIAKTLGQGTFYWLASRSIFGVAPKRFGFIAPALDEQLIWSDVSEDDLMVMVSRIARMAQGMWRGQYEPKADDNGCDYCEVRHACKKFGAHIRIDDKGTAWTSFEEAAAARRI